MHIRVLGSAAGGGFPQWNCNCENCSGLRSGTLNATPRTQSSIAVSSDGKAWLLINASPDIRAQLASFPALQPNRAKRDTSIAGVLLIDAQIDHTTGLLSLREGCPLTVYCTDSVYDDLSNGFPLFPMLTHWQEGLLRRSIPLHGIPFTAEGIDGLTFSAVPLNSNAPPYSPRRDNPQLGDNIGLVIEDQNTGGRLFYAPGLGQVNAEIGMEFNKADCLLVDGTLWTDDEMQRQGVGSKTGQAMGHLAQSGPGGMMEELQGLSDTRKILIHINNTNPILDESSPQRAMLEQQGIEVAFDGMNINI